jgi:hypothetical protein
MLLICVIFNVKPLEYNHAPHTIITIEHHTYAYPKKNPSLVSLSYACAIGSATGLLSYAISGFYFPFNWYLTYQLRSILVQAMLENTDEYYRCTESVYNAAWIADWVVYLSAFGLDRRIHDIAKRSRY